MKYANEVAVPATGTSLKELFSLEDEIKSGFIILQCPVTNAANVLFGTSSKQPAFIKPEGSAEIRFAHPKDVFVKGTAPDTVILLVL